MEKIFNSIFVIIISLVSVNSQPVIQWEKDYNGTGNSFDKIICIKPDPYSTDIYVCGYVTNIGSGMDIVTIKYNSTGTIAWSAVYNGTGNSTDYPVDMDVSSNWVTICGSSIGASGNYDIIYQVYITSTGVPSFSNRFNGTANRDDFASSIRVDIGGTRFVSGITTNSFGNTDLILLNYGGIFSQVIYNGPANRNETGGFFKFKNGVSGNYMLAGTTEVSATDKQIYIAEYNGFGSVVWSTTDPVSSGINEVTGFEMGPSLSLLVYGSLPVTPSPSGIFVKQFSSAGASGLSYIHNHQAALNDKAVSMKVDNSGNVYVAGYTFRGGSNDYVTFKLNSSLAQLWSNYYNGPASGSDLPGAISVDNSGNAIVTGTSPGISSGNDIATIWYDVNGTQRWTQRFNGTAGGNDEGTGALLLTSGQFIICGSSTSISSGADMKLIKYSDAAMPVILNEFSGRAEGRSIFLNWVTSDEINNAGFDVERLFIPINSSEGETPGWKKVTFIPGNGTTNQLVNYTFEDKNLNSGKYKYRLKQTDYNGNFEYFSLNDPDEIIIGNPAKYELSQNFPNPSNPKTTINYSVPFESNVSIKVYDMLGREAAVLLNGIVKAGYNSVVFDGSNLASGIYFYRIRSGEFTEIKKMILVK